MNSTESEWRFADFLLPEMTIRVEGVDVNIVDIYKTEHCIYALSDTGVPLSYLRHSPVEIVNKVNIKKADRVIPGDLVSFDDGATFHKVVNQSYSEDSVEFTLEDLTSRVVGMYDPVKVLEF
jgi:hypothetical protein